MKKNKGSFSATEKAQFEAGVLAHGWGSWTKIAKEFVPTRTPAQLQSYSLSSLSESQRTMMKQRTAAAKAAREEAAYEAAMAKCVRVDSYALVCCLELRGWNVHHNLVLTPHTPTTTHSMCFVITERRRALPCC